MKTDEAPGFVAETLLTHRLLDAGTIIERLVHRWKDTCTIVAPPTRQLNVDTIAAVSTITAKDGLGRTEANPRTPAAMIKVGIAPRKLTARPINPTLAFAVPPRRNSPKIAEMNRHQPPLSRHRVLRSVDHHGLGQDHASNPACPSTTWSSLAARSLKTTSPTIQATTRFTATSSKTSRTVHRPRKTGGELRSWG